MNTVIKRILLLGFCAVELGCLGTAHAASFDCAKARTRVEKTICRDPSISKLDGQLGEVYDVAIAQADPTQKKLLVSQELDWLKNVRDPCATQACFRHAYRTRLDELKAFGDKNKIATSTSNKDKAANLQSSFLGQYVAYPVRNYLNKAIPISPGVKTFVENLNQFRAVPFDSPNPRLSPRYPQFYRPHWTRIPWNRALAKTIVTEWVTGGQAHVAHCKRVARCESAWQGWLKASRALREKGEPVLSRTSVDLLGDGKRETIIRLRMPPNRHAEQTRSLLHHSDSSSRPFIDSKLYMLPSPHPHMARWFNGYMGPGWVASPTDIIGNARDKEHPYYVLTWNSSGVLASSSQYGIKGTIGVTAFAKSSPGQTRPYHYVPLGNIAWIRHVHVVPGSHQWPHILYQTSKLCADCAQALKVAEAQFLSDKFYLHGPPSIPTGLGSTFALGPKPGDISGGDGIQYDHRFFKQLTPPAHGTTAGTGTYVFWQREASQGRRIVVVDEPMNWQGDWYALFSIAGKIRPAVFWAHFPKHRFKNEPGITPVISYGWRPPFVFSDRKTGRLWAINVSDGHAWYLFTFGAKAASSCCTIRFQPPPPEVQKRNSVFLLPTLPSAIHRLAKTLNVVLGPDENSGTLHSVAALRVTAQATWANVAMRPWALTEEPYNSLGEINTYLHTWAKANPRHQRLYHNLKVEYPVAERSLARYYRVRLHKSTKVANALATRALSIAFRSYFVFSHDSTSQ